jgi:hypothetical protein
MAIVLREVLKEAKVYALDTFAGMPSTDKNIDAHNPGDFSDTSLEKLNSTIERLKLTNLIPIKGYFQDTFPKIDSKLTFGLAHIDADIYSSIKYAQDAVWPRMTDVGYVVYDDAGFSSCIGATEAVEELIQERQIHCEQIWPHFVFRAGLPNEAPEAGFARIGDQEGLSRNFAADRRTDESLSRSGIEGEPPDLSTDGCEVREIGAVRGVARAQPGQTRGRWDRIYARLAGRVRAAR